MVSAILLAAGKGSRFARAASKVLFKLRGKPVIYYSLSVLNKHPQIDEIIIVVSFDNLKEIKRIVRRYKINKASKVILGGRERKDSVACGLGAIDPRAGFVLVQDGARPFITSRMISSSIAAAKRRGGAVVGVPVKYTVKEVWGHRVVKTLERERLWEIQTPQVFRREVILKAYKNKSGRVTDDSMLAERIGIKPGVVLGSYANLKITTFEDAVVAEAILRKGI